MKKYRDCFGLIGDRQMFYIYIGLMIIGERLSRRRDAQQATTARKTTSLIVGQVQGSPRVIIIAYRTSSRSETDVLFAGDTRSGLYIPPPAPPITFRHLSISISLIAALYSFPITRHVSLIGLIFKENQVLHS